MKFKLVHIITFLILFHSFSFAEKTDIIILKNGDRITGEVKRMEFAVLTLKTDNMSTIEIEWKKIQYVKSKFSFRVERENGINTFGIINTDTLNNELIVGIAPHTDKINLDKVVLLIPIKETFLDALSISTDIGFSYTKASDVSQFNISGNLNHRTRLYERSIDFTSIMTSQVDTSQSQNHDYKFQVKRLLLRHWYLVGGIGAQKNTQLGLDLRLLINGGGGNDLIRNNSNILSTGGGLQLTREWTNGAANPQNNLEGIFNIKYSKFRYTSPKINWTTTFNAYPNLTTKGRYRIEFETKLKWEIIKDLFWKLTFFDNYDNMPKSSSTEKNDYGITISFGWTF